jgi:hypothetical protein
MKRGNSILVNMSAHFGESAKILQIEDFLRTFSKRYYTVYTAAQTFGRPNADQQEY